MGFYSVSLSRKALLAVIILMGLILYVGPNFLQWLLNKAPGIIDPYGSAADCIEAYTEKLLVGDTFDYSVTKSYGTTKNSYLPFIGNGKIGLSVPDNQMFLHHGRSLSLHVNYHPVVEFDIPGVNGEESSYVVHYKHGLVYRLQCFNLVSIKHTSVLVTSQFFMHRTIPSLLVQTVEIQNLSDEHVTVLLRRNLPNPALHEISSGYEKLEHFQYHKFSDFIKHPDSEKGVVVLALSVSSPDALSVRPKSSASLSLKTVVHYSSLLHVSEHNKIDMAVKETEGYAEKELVKSFDTPVVDLRRKHINVWEQLWKSGFSISISRAHKALNGDKVNATLYYVLSSMREYLAEDETSSEYSSSLQHYLYSPDRCYSGHSTLQASTLWSDLTSAANVNSVVSLWLLTLNKQGCHNLVQTGATGVMQAMLLSFGGFKFTNHHLEFDCDPKDLHRDYHFRRIMYGNSTFINVSVTVQDDNKALLYTSLDKADKDYYGCDGGCLDAPVKLGSLPVQFPVKITTPLTAILYITPDRNHIEELRHTIHVKGVIEAPAHGHHIIALHRHGHQLGGLPAIFWVSVAFLIAVFHLFLIKLIYNEYCGNEEKSRKRYLV